MINTRHFDYISLTINLECILLLPNPSLKTASLCITYITQVAFYQMVPIIQFNDTAGIRCVTANT